MRFVEHAPERLVSRLEIDAKVHTGLMADL